ncbi:hypothetical protein F4818DRAFT_436807 [Hypoxylon cercidicola]|nr:hypothetical protein F4818DRAFT_436807 [Hypoxylon cercidicola]
MAESASSEGELHHHIPRSIQIPFETFPPIAIPNQTQDPEDESESESIDDSSDNGTDWGIVDQDGFDIFQDMELPLVDAANGAMWVEVLDASGDPIQGMVEEAIAIGMFHDLLTDDTDLELDLDGLHAPAQDPPPEPGGLFDEEGPPRIAKWRLNLTALSQIYNIYLVAYENGIHVSRPRSCITNALPPEPDLILQPPASEMSISVGGYLDDDFPHQVNHLIVGELGQEEILLLAYDDGDVIGYYTRHIENELIRREREGQLGGPAPEPFFHENVGKSAWGLAVHKQSRIIAVSSNLHNVCVFVFALTGASYKHTVEADSVELFRNIVKNENGNVVDPRRGSSRTPQELDGDKAEKLEGLIRHRDANWRIVLETGHRGTNIPNITFSNDFHGEADKIVAVDINGALWLMDIWNFNKHPHITIESLHRNRYYRNPRGWGVLVLPESSFLPTKDYKDSVGISSKEAKYVADESIGRWVDISQGIKHVKNNSTVHPWMRSNNRNRFAINPLENGFRHRSEGNWYSFTTTAIEPPVCDTVDDRMLPVRHEHLLGKFKSRASASGQKWVLGDGSSILRTYELDIELRSFEDDGYGIMFEKAIDQSRPPHTVIPSMRVSHERLSNLVHVPELSLVVAGSMCGRVALVTLTRPKEDIYSFGRGFKIEAILPTKYDEDSQMRPICPLLGVAVAPVPFSGNTDLADGPIGRRRYRIMLHYYDLRILSYELSRNSANDCLYIV